MTTRITNGRIANIVATLLIATTLMSPPLRSQTTSSPQLHFEVASIHMVDPHTVDDLRKGIGLASLSTFPSARFTVRNWTLKILISLAYGVDDKYIQGDPGWLDAQEYDIDAKVEGEKELTYEQMKPLLQQFLEQRFHLATHREEKTLLGYALVVAKGAKGGAKLIPSKEGVIPSAQIFPSGLQARHSTTKDLAQILARPLGYPVVDKTGIEGAYDIKLDFAPANDPNSARPSIFTAVQEQLGLKLESQKVPVELLVIDHVEMIPTEN
jgi:uncharacterized protein (TIGR03435 family)